MPLEKSSMPCNRKRKLCVEAEPATDSSSPPTAKRRKLENQQRYRTPSSFWDNLSRLWLTPRALREFDRRTVWPAAPVPPERTSKEDIDLVQLKRFARHGGPSLDHLRAYPEPETAAPSNRMMDSSQSGSRKRAKISDTSSKTRKSSAYDPNFEQHLINNGIYPHGYDHGDDNGSVYPDNWEEINEMLARPRPSLSPSRFPREAFRKFEKTNMQALTENTVMSKAFPIIAGTADIPSQENLYFGNLKHLTDGSITKAKPDFYDGSRPVELDKHIREELGPYIVPSTNTAAPCLPNFFTEAKGPNGSAPVSKLQAMYDGALGARGVHELRSYVGQETPFDNKAYTITSTYHHSGLLTIYTTHPTASESPTNPTEYRITQLNSFAMTGNPETFRQGAGALRNARDWAKEKREELIAAANGKVPDAEYSDLVSSTQSFTSQPSNEPTRPESETSADELALDADTFTSSSRRAPVGARTKPPPPVSSNQRSKKTRRVNNRSGTGSGGSQVI
ncbi:hypothetical protein OEA41_009057 [Lepraria neglecta]|uniref:DUF7924 domain-containing protein n=1 Tax=Lepraria neglecta TaxID=209136 RepID=A0AAD9Z561_9LECA|nr:hypothetical protein OEA41_009057 [Lepraria neglecta]